MTENLRVTVWNEYRHEKSDEEVAGIYPDGIHTAIADFLGEEGFEVRTATLDEQEHGLTDEVLNTTDVLLWWGHIAHDEVEDAVVEKVRRRVLLDGMGLIVLHSGHFSKIFKSLMGTTCDLKWRESNDRERLWVVSLGHQISEGVGEYIEIEHEETYGEFFDVPPPDELVFVSWFSGGEVFRSGLCYRRGRGKVFYFRPGHETLPTYHDPQVRRVISNAVRWATPTPGESPVFGNVPPAEEKGRI